jgi:CheY-like chemotaxis protein
MPQVKSYILIIDDDEDVRRLLARQLQSLNHAVKMAADGEEGLTMASSELFDLVFVDHQMPGMAGNDVIRELRSAGVESKIVVITASLDDRIFEQYMEPQLSVDGFLNKPFDLGQVERCLDTVMVRGGKFLSPF